MSKPKASLRFSHFGLYVRDLEKMRDFYCRVLGFLETDRGMARGRRIVFLSREPMEHHQIVLVEGRSDRPEDLEINQISMRVGSLAELKQRYALVKCEPAASDFNPTDHGTAWSLYFRDPEGNRIELFADTPWYVEHPRIDPLDLDASEQEIMARTRAAIEGHPTFRPIETWRHEFAAKLEGRLVQTVR